MAYKLSLLQVRKFMMYFMSVCYGSIMGKLRMPHLNFPRTWPKDHVAGLQEQVVIMLHEQAMTILGSCKNVYQLVN